MEYSSRKRPALVQERSRTTLDLSGLSKRSRVENLSLNRRITRPQREFGRHAVGNIRGSTMNLTQREYGNPSRTRFESDIFQDSNPVSSVTRQRSSLVDNFPQLKSKLAQSSRPLVSQISRPPLAQASQSAIFSRNLNSSRSSLTSRSRFSLPSRPFNISDDRNIPGTTTSFLQNTEQQRQHLRERLLDRPERSRTVLQVPQKSQLLPKSLVEIPQNYKNADIFGNSQTRAQRTQSAAAVVDEHHHSFNDLKSLNHIAASAEFMPQSYYQPPKTSGFLSGVVSKLQSFFTQPVESKENVIPGSMDFTEPHKQESKKKSKQKSKSKKHKKKKEQRDVLADKDLNIEAPQKKKLFTEVAEKQEDGKNEEISKLNNKIESLENVLVSLQQSLQQIQSKNEETTRKEAPQRGFVGKAKNFRKIVSSRRIREKTKQRQSFSDYRSSAELSSQIMSGKLASSTPAPDMSKHLLLDLMNGEDADVESDDATGENAHKKRKLSAVKNFQPYLSFEQNSEVESSPTMNRKSRSEESLKLRSGEFSKSKSEVNVRARLEEVSRSTIEDSKSKSAVQSEESSFKRSEASTEATTPQKTSIRNLKSAAIQTPANYESDEFDATHIDETLAKIERTCEEFSPVKTGMYN